MTLQLNEHRIILALQRDIPLERRPFATLADSLEVKEAEVLTVANRMLQDGSARRVGAVFDARRLGYRSELCALDVSAPSLAAAGAIIVAHAGVTHCYQRGIPPDLPPFPALPGVSAMPNLWFTLAVLHDRFDREMGRLQTALAPHAIRRLPAVRRFKIDVVFDPDQRDAGEQVPGAPTGTRGPDEPDAITPQLSPDEQAWVRALQGHLAVQSDFYDPAAKNLGCDPDTLLARLRTWRRSGVLRRMAMIVRHRQLGFKANAMCIWPVDPDAVVAAGRRLATWPTVTHCYQRITQPDWPFNLYAMIHTADWCSTQALFESISAATGLTNGRMLGSLHEFKKTSMQYFGEPQSSLDYHRAFLA